MRKAKRYNILIAVNLIEKMNEIQNNPPLIPGFTISRLQYLIHLILSQYILSTLDKMFRKHPKTFLNGKCWNDEIVGKPIFKPVYGDLLNDPRWQRKRLEIFQRDDFTCQLCNDTETELQEHHKKYIAGKATWEYEDTDLITLCVNCHKKIS
jgi:hypothetical protein